MKTACNHLSPSQLETIKESIFEEFAKLVDYANNFQAIEGLVDEPKREHPPTWNSENVTKAFFAHMERLSSITLDEIIQSMPVETHDRLAMAFWAEAIRSVEVPGLYYLAPSIVDGLNLVIPSLESFRRAHEPIDAASVKQDGKDTSARIRKLLGDLRALSRELDAVLEKNRLN